MLVPNQLKLCWSRPIQWMDAICKKSGQVKEEWLTSLATIREQIPERMSRCSLKGKRFSNMQPATEEEVAAVASSIREIDQRLEKDKLQKQHTQSKRDYIGYKEIHCLERQYTFQVWILQRRKRACIVSVTVLHNFHTLMFKCCLEKNKNKNMQL